MAREKGKRTTKGSQGFNRKTSEEFLAKNAQKPEVMITESGLQYLVLEHGEGTTPTIDDSVLVHQRITLVDGTIVADTYKKGDQAEFSLQEAIPGYREGLLLMKLNGRYRFFIHPDLAWGKRGAGKKIGPNAVLIIDVRLTRIM